MASDDLSFGQRRSQQKFSHAAAPGLDKEAARLRSGPEIKGEEKKAAEKFPGCPGLVRQAHRRRDKTGDEDESNDPDAERLPAFTAYQPDDRVSIQQFAADDRPPFRSPVFPGVNPAPGGSLACFLLPGVGNQKRRAAKQQPGNA